MYLKTVKNLQSKKNKKKQYSRTLAKVKMQKSKKPRENQKKQKKQYSRSLEIGSTGKSPGINCFFFVFFCFFWFSRGFLDFCIFTFARVLEYCFFFFSSFFCFFWFSRGFLEIWRSQKKKLVFGNFAKLKKHLSFAKIQKSQDYAYILEYFWNFRKTPLFAIYPFLLYWIAHIIICLSFVFMY